MRILIVNQFFWPDIAPTAQYLGDLSRHLSAEGHDVTVICSAGSYAPGQYSDEGAPQVKVIRIPGLPYRRGALARLISYGTFFVGAMWHELRVPKPDLIVSMTTPPMLGLAGAIVKKLRGTRHFLWEMDLFPEALVSLGVLTPRGYITRFLGWIQDVTRRRSDGVIVLGPCMKMRLLEQGLPAHLVRVAENWADGNAISCGPSRRSGPINIFYSGNLGLTHDIDTIAHAMRFFREDARFLFTFAGGGAGRTRIQQICADEGIGNVRFVPYADRADLNKHLAQADIGLVTERPDCIGTVVPSKTYSLMAAGRPILFIGPKQATPGLMIEHFQCGWQIDPGDNDGVITLLEWLSANRDVVCARGKSARAAFSQNYDAHLGVARIAAALDLAPGIAKPLRDRLQAEGAVKYPAAGRKVV